MEVRTKVWVNCQGLRGGECPFNSTAEVNVLMQQGLKKSGRYSEHFRVSEYDLWAALEEVGWVRQNIYRMVCLLCAADGPK